jgi:hypothetical protein
MITSEQSNMNCRDIVISNTRNFEKFLLKHYSMSLKQLNLANGLMPVAVLHAVRSRGVVKSAKRYC